MPGDGDFAQARERGVDMDAPGARPAAYKAELLADIKKNGLPPSTTRSFTGHDMTQGEPVEAEA